MTIKKCFMTNSTCYKQASQCQKIYGIVVHDTGAGNPDIKRYVQPLETDANYDEVIADIGVNKYGNDWNHKEREAGVHAFIGKNAKGEVETYEVLPETKFAWGVGAGANGSYNFNPAHYQFEICDDGYVDEDYFNSAFTEAIEYCAYLCQRFKLNPMADICSHHESYVVGYGSNHGDCDQWLKKFGKDMNWFRTSVKEILDRDYPYTVFNANSELVAYCASLDDAKKYLGCTIYYLGEIVKTEREQFETNSSAEEEKPEEIATPNQPTTDIDKAEVRNIFALIIACIKAIIKVIKEWNK